MQQLCAFGQRLLDLDAEDFGLPDAATGANTDTRVADRVVGDGVPLELRARALACRMPQAAQERHRGALGSLRPAYSLLLEVIEAHWRRRETAALVLGHVGGPGSSAARRVLRVAQDDVAGWRSYLDRQHSNTAHALAVCAVECERPCTVVTRLSNADQRRVAQACRLALAFVDSPIVRLRHSAPVGHGFGVPSPGEVLDAWQRSRERLARLERSVLADDGFPLPGLPSLFTALAGAPIAPGTLLADTADAVVAALSR